MLNETLDRTMAKAKRYENVTRASKYSSVYKALVKDNSLQDNIMKRKIKKYAKKQSSTVANKYDYDTNMIVEDPDEIIVHIDYNKESNGMPFFRSVYSKLAKIYGR